MDIQQKALSFLYGELRRAKIALGRAEGKPNVQREEIESLQSKIEAIDWLIPLAIAEPVKHGRWIDNTKIIEGYPDYQFNCSECNYTVWRAEPTKYCPECGARMDAKGDEQ